MTQLPVTKISTCLKKLRSACRSEQAPLTSSNMIHAFLSWSWKTKLHKIFLLLQQQKTRDVTLFTILPVSIPVPFIPVSVPVSVSFSIPASVTIPVSVSITIPFSFSGAAPLPVTAFSVNRQQNWIKYKIK